jgi:hypothetical protein
MSSFYRGYDAQHVLGEVGGVSLFWSNDSRLLIEPPLMLQSAMDRRYSSIAQAAAVAALLLIYVLRLLLPKAPQWCRHFAPEEPCWQTGTPSSRAWSFPATTLLLLSLAGLALGSLSAASHADISWGWLDLTPWVVAVLLTVAARPRTTPKTLLAVFSIVVVHIFFTLYTTYSRPQEVNVIHVGMLCVAIGAIGAILCSM